MKLSVVIPTFRRPESLERCLKGLSEQLRAPDEVLIVAQASDLQTTSVLNAWAHFRPLRPLQLSTVGAVAQYNAGLAAAQGDVVAITDDDTIPRSDWLQRIEEHFQHSPDLGGVGGLDLVHQNGTALKGRVRQVGVIQWFGRIVGNHHLGAKYFRSIDILKGANMAFRAEAIRGLYFETDLRGRGAQICLDMAFSLDVKRRGWRLLYDPRVIVDHFPARRFDEDQRGAPNQKAIEDTSFNTYLTLLRHLSPGWKRRMALLWVRAVGLGSTPGALRGLLWRLKGDRQSLMARDAAKRAWTDARKAAGLS